tara:strand:+ start:4652 stop:6649 length:1998 start_codon:yes stop_codon:yes gene_type:complete
MAQSVGKRNDQAILMSAGLKERNLSFCLGRSDSSIINNSPEGNNDTNDNSMFAQRITSNDIKTVVQFGATETKYWTTGLAPHCYYSDGTSKGQHLFVSDGILFMVVGMSGIQNRIDKMGSILTRNKPSRIDGGIETVDGISYMAINAVPDSFDQMSSRYQEVALFDDLLEKVNSTTSESTRAMNICGAGNELKTGNCCLYYSESGYDSIAGITYAAGEFYKCLCSKCYRCVEMAEALNMKYVFHKFLGGTGTTGGTGATGPACKGCDSEDNKADDCGPCGCTIDWNENSSYINVINDNNITSNTALGRNATIINHHKENLSGSVLSANIDLSNLTIEEKMITTETYDTNIKNGTLYLPIRAGSTKKEAFIPISTVYDSARGRHIIDGFGKPKEHERGSGYTSAVVDTNVWGQIFPNWSGDVNDRVKINLTPIGGIAMHLDEILELSTVIHVVVNTKNISDTFEGISTNSPGPKEFDFYSIQEFKDEEGQSIYSGLGKNATNYKSLVPVVTVGPVSGSFSSSGSGFEALPKSKDVMHNSERLVTTGNKKIYSNTTLNNLVAYDAEYISTKAVRVPLQTSYAKDLVGKTLCVVTNIDDIAAKLSMDVESVYYHPKSNGNADIDFTKTKTLFRNPVTIDLSDNQASTQSVISFEILWGSQDPSKVTTS